MNINFLINKAVKLHIKGELDKAKEIYEKIIKFDQNNLIANGNLGALLNAKKNYKNALYFLENALTIKPNYLEALNNKGISLRGLNQHEEALKLYDQILNIKPNYINALNNKGNCLRNLNSIDEAINIYNRALKLKPNFVDALYNLAICFHSIGNFDEAIKNYNKTIEFYPEFIDAHYNLGMIQLLKGNFHDGLKNYEWRKKRNPLKEALKLIDKKKEWDGSDTLKNKEIFIYKEQGLGDYIQYSRYLPIIYNMGAKIILDVPKSIKALIDTMNFEYKIMDKPNTRQYDYCCSLISLPYLLGTELNNIPNNIPYIFTPKNERDNWLKKLKTNKEYLVGIKWSGNPNNKEDKNRSMKLKEIKPLLNLPFQFHCLDFELNDEDKKVLSENQNIVFHGKNLLGMEKTAGLIENLDLVISVDTSIAHISSSIGKPVWLLLSYLHDSRWMLNRDDSPWYPNLIIIKQTRHKNWSEVIKIVYKKLKNHFNKS
tara:strand:+ start:389 stop:1846 length:1458 start_codon:yes stop_codon:yes gene_type:complete